MDTNTNSQNTENEVYENLPAAFQAAGQEEEPSYIQLAHQPSYSAPGSPVPLQKRSRRRGGLIGLMLAAMLVLGMLLGGVGAGAVLVVAGNVSLAAAPAVAATGANTTAPAAQLVSQTNQSSAATINNIYKAISPSVVKISGTVTQSNGRFSMTGEATGTGIIIDASGYILTNNHVIQGASNLTVELADGSKYPATVSGASVQNDLAVIKIAATNETLTPARLGDSATVQVGDQVVAVGYPYGLDQSVTSGIVSGLNRDGSSSQSDSQLTGLIQVDAAINPGNSGGPLLNMAGEVIGINTMLEGPVDGFTGVGLSIPINQVKDLLTQLENGQTALAP